MKYRKFKEIIHSDIFRYTGNVKMNKFMLIYRNVGIRYTIVMRALVWLRQNPFLWPLFLILKWYYSHLTIKYGIDIPYETKIGPGLYIGHYGGIVVNKDVIIGNNCNLNHGVTLGRSYGGKNPGCPQINNNVFLGAGSIVFGNIEIGNNVAIGANCVVSKSVPNSAVVVGIPGKIISYNGSTNYISNFIQ